MRPAKSMTFCALAVWGLLWAPFPLCPAQESQLVAAESGLRSADAQSTGWKGFQLLPDALQTARILGLASDIEKLSSFVAAKETGQTAASSLEELSLRQHIADAVVAASLDIDSVTAEVDYEREQTVELRSLLRYKRDRAIGSTNLAVLAAGTGLGIVSGVLQFSKTTETAGNYIGFAAGGVSTLFSLRSFRQVHGGQRPAWILPNMLAAFLGQPEEQHSHYPDDIWAYLNSIPAGEASSRKERMMAGWAAAGRIGPPDSLQWKRRIALLTSTNAAEKDLNIELLNERAAMLADVSNQISLMKHDLADLLRALQPK